MRTQPAPKSPSADLFGWIIELGSRYSLNYWGMRLSVAFVSLSPPWLSYSIASFIGRIVYHLWSAKRRIARENVQRVMGNEADPQRIDNMVRRLFISFAKDVVDFLRLPNLTEHDVLRRVHTVGWHHLDEALRGGKGVVFVTIHMGSWDLAGAFLALRGYAVSAVADTFRPKRLNDLILGYREQKGVRIIPRDGALRGMIRALRRNEILGLLVDRPAQGEGVPVRFFNAVAELPAGAATLALKTGASLIAGCITRRPDNTFVGLITPPIEISPSGEPQRDVRLLTQKMVSVMEDFIRNQPDQWYMFDQLWQDGSEPAPQPRLAMG
ncbi:MAG: lysophospholipid acyltransferase family protein [Chloroflexi bacterium]|nr:lysophospholipid acyltransferase family protein [Chloroflexota bacterium]